MNIKVLQFHIEYEQAVFYSLCMAALSLVLGYLFFINATVIQIVERQKIEEGVALVRATLAEKEATYFTKVDTITLSLALSHGFKEAKKQTFVAQQGLGKKVLTLESF